MFGLWSKGSQDVEKKEKVVRTSLRKSYTGSVSLVIAAIAVAWMIFQIVIAAQFIFLSPHRIRIIHLGFAVVMIFLISPISSRSNLNKLRVWDVGLALVAVGAFSYAYMRHGVLLLMGGRFEQIDIYLGIVVILLLYEAARRVISPGLLGLSLVTLAYVFFGHLISGPLAHTGFDITRVVRHIYIGGEGIFGFALGVTAEIIVMFVVFGAILQEVGISDYFYDLANAIAGRHRGGPAKVAVLSSALMGTVSGETSANVATTGAFTIPMMKRVGYDKNFSGAVECSASAGGQILPPIMGATAFMMADTTGIPYLTIAIAAILPALLYFTSVFFVVHFRAVRLNLRGVDDLKPDWVDLLKRSYLLLPLFGIVALLLNRYTPTFSAFWGGIVTALVISFFRKDTRINFAKLVNIFKNSARTVMTLSVATAIVGVIVGSFSLTGISMTMARIIFSFSGGIFLLTLIITMFVAIILGMGLPTSAAYVLASISAAPALMMLGIDLLPAHLFVFYFGAMSAITPPVATGAFAAAALSGGNPNYIGFNAMRLSIAGFLVPFIFIYQSDILIGPGVNPVLSAFTFVVSLVGVIYLCAFFEGSFFVKAGAVKRVIYLAVAVPLIWPNTFLSAIGLAVAAVVFAVDVVAHKKNRSALRTA